MSYFWDELFDEWLGDSMPFVRRGRYVGRKKDWHDQRTHDEPECGPQEWRTRDRAVVIHVTKMSDGHLKNAWLFSERFRQHASRRRVLLEEISRRREVSLGAARR